MCKSNRDDRKLESTVKQSRFEHLGELHKKSTEAGDIFRKRATKPLLKQKKIVRSILHGLGRKITGLLLSGPKSSFQMEVNFAFNLEIKVPESGGRVERHIINVAWSPVWSFQSVIIWVAMSSAGAGPLCFLKSTVIYQDILEHFMLPSADKIYGDADFIFQQDLAPAHTAKGTKSWFNDHGVTVLDWPANLPDLNPIDNLWGIVKRKMRDTRRNNAEDLKVATKATWASITPEQCHRLIDSMPRRIDAVIHAKVGPTKYWVHMKWTNFSEAWHFCF